jgi:hypothetical protein
MISSSYSKSKNIYKFEYLKRLKKGLKNEMVADG